MSESNKNKHRTVPRSSMPSNEDTSAAEKRSELHYDD